MSPIQANLVKKNEEFASKFDKGDTPLPPGEDPRRAPTGYRHAYVLHQASATQSVRGVCSDASIEV
jgi:hypothetical protein